MYCKDCEFHDSGCQNKISGRGDKTASIMIVGDYVTQSDDDTNRPIMGDSGQKLKHLLNRCGLKRKDVYISHAIKCKPWSPKKIKTVHVNACRKHLFKEILRVRPKVIVACGSKSLESLLGEEATKDFRGFLMPFEFTYEKQGVAKRFRSRVIPTYGMLACLSDWTKDSMVIHDIKKAIYQVCKNQEATRGIGTKNNIGY